MSQAVLLYQLQQIDTEIREKKQELKSVLDALNEPASLLAARERVHSAETRQKQAQAQQRQLELKLGSHNAKLKSSSDRMYSGKVTSTRELADLQKEVEMLKRQQASIEDESLEAMLELEEASEEVEAATDELAEEESAWQTRSAKLQDQKQQLAIFLHGALQGRKRHVGLIETKHMASYESIGKKRRGVAVVALKHDGTCAGCLTGVSLATSKKVDQGEIAYCGSCGRMLVAP